MFYYFKFDAYLHDVAKSNFKKLGLSHWDNEAKIALFMFTFFVPVVLIFILVSLNAAFWIFNNTLNRLHASELK